MSRRTYNRRPVHDRVTARITSGTTFLVFCACLLALVIARVSIGAGDGLSAQYFANGTFTPPESFRARDAVPNASAMREQWQGQVPATFSVRWTGSLSVPDTATYAFALTSDDASFLYIDGRPIVENGGQHSATTVSGTVPLARGSHRVILEYVQNGGEIALDWSWSVAGAGAGTSVPWWRLSNRPASPAEATAVRAISLLTWLLGIATAMLGAWRLWPTVMAQVVTPVASGDAFVVTWRRQTGWLLVFAALAVVETWPLASNPAHLSRNDNGDTMLNEWTMAWVVHQAPRDIVHLFDANIFHPTPHVLAYSEALLVQSAFAAPLLWAGASPVLAYNLVLIAGLALSGWTMCLVVARWTRDWASGAAAGIVFAFSAALLTNLPHMQALHVEFVAPMLWALDRLLDDPRVRRGASLALWFTLQALTSYYLLVIMGFGLAAATAVRWDAWRARGRRVAGALATAAGISAILLGPFLFEYWRVHHDAGMTRSFTDQLPTFWRDYFTTPSHVGQFLFGSLTSFTGLFPGLGGILLTLFAIATGALRQGRARMCVALGICGVLLSFGPDLPGYQFLYRAALPLQGIRAPARFGFLLTVAVAILGGMGFAALRRRIQSGATLAIVTPLILIVLVAESLVAPLWLRRFDGVPPIYGRLKGEPNAVVAEMPMPGGRATALNAGYLLNSTASWYRLVNGYSGFVPASYWTQSEAVADFPSAASTAALRAMGVTHIFVHRDQLGSRASGLADDPALRLIADDGAIALYAIR